MYATLAFAITLLGVFSIFELLKGNQKISLLKFHIIARLILLSAGSFFDYFELNGNEIPYYREIFKLITTVLFVNMLFLIVVKKLPSNDKTYIYRWSYQCINKWIIYSNYNNCKEVVFKLKILI